MPCPILHLQLWFIMVHLSCQGSSTSEKLGLQHHAYGAVPCCAQRCPASSPPRLSPDSSRIKLHVDQWDQCLKRWNMVKLNPILGYQNFTAPHDRRPWRPCYTVCVPAWRLDVTCAPIIRGSTVPPGESPGLVAAGIARSMPWESDLLYHRQRVLNAKISPLQVHQLSGFQERVRCFDTGRLLCLSQRPLRPEMVQTHFKVYLISSVCAPENVLQTKRERKRVAKKVFVQISSMSVSEFLVPSCSRAGSAQFCYHVLWIHQSHPCPLWKVVFGSKPGWKCSCLPLKAGVEQRRQIHQNHFIFQKICGQVDFVRVLLAYHRLWLAVARPDLSAGQMVWAGNTCAIHNWDAFCAGICRSLCGHRLDVWNDSVQSWPQGGLGWWVAFFPWSNEPRNLGVPKAVSGWNGCCGVWGRDWGQTNGALHGCDGVFLQQYILYCIKYQTKSE